MNAEQARAKNEANATSMAAAAVEERDWLEYGKKICRVAAVSYQWILGEWLLRYPRNKVSLTEDGTKVRGIPFDMVSDATGVPRGQLHDFAWVARRVPASVRTENRSWYHHRLVAKFEPDKQKIWLDHASQKNWSVAELRSVLKETEPKKPLSPKKLDADGRYRKLYAFALHTYEELSREERLTEVTQHAKQLVEDLS